MILQQVWNRFTADWKSFAMLGIGPVLASMAMSAVLVILGLITIGPSVVAVAMGRFGYSDARVLGMLGGMAVFLLLAMVVSALGTTLISAGLVGTVVAYRRGEGATVPAFWGYAKRYFRRFLVLGVLACLGVGGLFVVTSPLMAIPGIGWLIVIGVQSIVLVNLAVYPAYLMVAEDMSAMDAIRTGFRIVTQNIQEACMGGLVMLGFNVALAVTGVIPIVGQLAMLAASVVYGPVVVYYFAERFETNVRPLLGGSAQGPA